MAKFLILQSPTKSNIGTITERSDGFYKPSFYQISEQELDLFKSMNEHAKKAFIAEKLEAQIGTENKKKVVPIVEVVERVEESVSVEMPEVEEQEPLNEPINELEKKQIELYEKFDNHEKESQLNALLAAVEEPKAKGRPKKNK